MIFRFGPCTLDPERRAVRCDGKAARIEPQVFDLLHFLVRSGGRVVTKDEIVDEIWQGRAISDDALTSRIKSARQALGDDGRRQWAIRTVHRVGYQFVAPVETGEAAEDVPAASSRPSFPQGVPEAADLLDREEPRAAIAAARSDARAGRGRIVAVTGEAGIGKTSLIRRAVADAVGDGADWRVLRGACEDTAVAEPMGPLRDAVRGLQPPLPPRPEGLQRLDGFAAAFERIAETPTILVIEDLHWADDASADFLRFAARRIDTVPLLLLLSARSDDERGRRQLRAVLEGVAPDVVVRLPLPPLRFATVARLASEAGKAPGEVMALTDGNPLFVTELLRSAETIPVSVQDAVLGRADRLDPETRQFVDLVSVFVRAPDDALLAAVYAGDILSAVDAGAAAGLLIDTETGISFRHELTRRAVLDAQGATARRRLHGRALRALRTRSENPRALLLHHAEGARDTEAIVELAPAAAAEAERVGAHREAARYYEMALSHLPVEAAGPDLLSSAAHAHYLVGEGGRAVERQKDAVRLHEASGDRIAQGDALRLLSRFYWSKGELAPALASSERALALLSGTDGPEEAMALSARAQLAMLNLDYEAAKRFAGPAMDLAKRLGRDEILSHATNNFGMAFKFSNPPRAHALLDESIRLAEACGAPDHVARGWLNKSAMCEYQLDYASMDRLAGTAQAYCAAQELDGYAVYCAGLQAVARLRLGDWDTASALVEPLIADADGPGMETSLFPAHAVACWLAIRQGGMHEDHLGALRAFVGRADELQRTADLAAIEGERAWLGLAPKDAALALLNNVIGRVSEPVHAQVSILWLHRLAPGQVHVAPDRVHPAIGRELTGDPGTAADLWADLSMPYEAAIANVVAGRVAEARGILERLKAWGSLTHMP